MGMKSRSGHFFKTNGVVKKLKLNIQLFASKYDLPNTPKFINIEKQKRHLDGTPGKSQLIISLSECKKLLKEFSGNGTMIYPNQERVDFGKIIGYIDTAGGLKATTWGTIHYSKTGSHIVPYYQQYKKGSK